MIFYILKLNVKQLIRTLQEIGIFRTIVLILLVIGGYFIGINKIIENEHQSILATIVAALIVSIHGNRKDKYFLRKTTSKRYYIYVFQYIIIIFPLLVTAFVKLNFIFIGISLLSIFVISALNLNFVFKNNFKQITFKFINPTLFEWFTGIRKNWFTLILLYVLSFVLYKYEIAILIPTILISLTITTFFLEGESNFILQSFRKNAKSFLKFKIINNLKLLQLLFLPQYFFYLIMYPKHWFVVFIPIIFTSILLIFTILTKYSNYAPARNLNVNMFHIAFFTLCFIQPYLFPIPIIWIIRNYRKSIENLEFYLKK